MDLRLVLSALITVPGLTLVFFLMKKSGAKKDRNMTDEKFTVMLPKFAYTASLMCALGCTIIFAIIGIYQKGENAKTAVVAIPIMICVVWAIAGYIIAMTRTFKVIVDGNTITYHSLFRKPYTFTFDDIVSARRKAYYRANPPQEKLIVRTKDGKKLVVELAHVAYERFVKAIANKVSRDRLTGF